MHRLIIRNFFLLTCMGWNSMAFGQDVDFTHLKKTIDGPEIPILSMTQDIHGYLWMATQNGLFRYDGQSYVTYHKERLNLNSLTTDYVECLATDSAGFVWLASRYAGMDRLDPSSGTFTHFRHNKNDSGSLANDTILALLVDRQGTLWIGTFNGLDRLDKNSKKFVHYRYDTADTTTISCNVVREIYEDRLGSIWVGTGSVFAQQDFPELQGKGGLNKLDRSTGKFTRYEHRDSDSQTLIDNRITAIFEDSRGNFWVGTAGDGLHTMDRVKGTFKRHTLDNQRPDKLSRPMLKPAPFWAEDHISFIIEDNSGKILIGTFCAGINVYDPNTNKVSWYSADVKSNKKLPDDAFWTAYKTSDNTVWIAAWGVNVYQIFPRKNPFSNTTTHKTTIAFMEDDKQNLWVGGFDGLAQRQGHGVGPSYYIDPTHPTSLINLAFPVLRDRHKLITQTPGGLYSFDTRTKEFTRFLHHDPRDENSVTSDTIPSIRRTAEGDLWISGGHGANFYDIKTRKVTRFRNDPEDSTTIMHNEVYCVEIDNKQTVWFGTGGGISRLDKGTTSFKRYPMGIVFDIKVDSRGNVWAGSEDGLYKYAVQRDEFIKFKDEYAMLPNSLLVGWVMEDHSRNLWLVTNKGIIELREENNMRPVIFGKSMVPNSSALTSGYVTHDGNLVFGDSAGFTTLDPSLLTEKKSSHQITLSNLILNDEPVVPTHEGVLTKELSQTAEIKLAHNQNTMSFQFVNIDFISAPEDTHLLYRLENYDDGWRKAGEDNTAHYYNIPPGNYRFKVVALNSLGNAAEKSLSVIIVPPWWRTWWAYAMFLLALGSSAYIVYTSRIRQIRRQQASQISVMVATQEQERKRISRDLHDGVGTKLSALKLFVSSLQEKAVLSNDEELTSLADSSEQFIKEVISDVRNLLLNLSPSVLEEFGYITAVEGLVSKLNETKHACFSLTVFGIDSRLQPDYELALYRITQELINNVLKHAAAKNVALQIGQRDEKIILMIEDDGKGFDLNGRGNGYGLQNLVARTKLMHGIMTIDSSLGKGTSVLIEVPYEFNKS